MSEIYYKIFFVVEGIIMKKKCIIFLFCLCLFIVIGIFIYKKIDKEIRKAVMPAFGLLLEENYYGKELTVEVAEKEMIDAEYLQKVIDGEITGSGVFWELWNERELEKMIEYLDENNLMLAPGIYTFFQQSEFEDGLLVLNGEKTEVFKYKTR